MSKQNKKSLYILYFFSIFGSTFRKGRMSLISGFVTHFWFSMPKGIFVVRIIYI
jgi:hypothetical protein